MQTQEADRSVHVADRFGFAGLVLDLGAHSLADAAGADVALPFANLSGDPGQGYFADGMVEEITTALSRVRWFFVIARNSSSTYRGRSVDVKQVGRELDVRYVLEGSVRKAGNRLRITAQLTETETDAHVWADRFDGIGTLSRHLASTSGGKSPESDWRMVRRTPSC